MEIKILVFQKKFKRSYYKLLKINNYTRPPYLEGIRDKTPPPITSPLVFKKRSIICKTSVNK